MRTLCFFALFFALPALLPAQNADSAWFRQHYYKKEVMIPMRDGVRLFTAFYIPKDTTQKHPFIMARTPYSCRPYGEENYGAMWAGYRSFYLRQGYIVVSQDVRGRYMSEGVFEDVRPFNKNKKGKETDEASDTYDAIDWMVKNIPHNNGRVGVMGTSYPGFYSTQAALSGHPALKAVSPQAPVTDWFIGDDFHHNGAFFAMDGFQFYSVFGKPRPQPLMDYGSGYEFKTPDNYAFYLNEGSPRKLAEKIGDSIRFWHQMYEHPNYDEWWQARDARRGLYNIKPAMLWVGGLFDAEDCFGAWNSYKAAEKQSPQTSNRIVMGPWYHGQWSATGWNLGNVRFGSNTSAWYQQNIEIPFFQHYLKDSGSDAGIAEATIFFTGENKWRQLPAWPAKNVSYQNIYLQDSFKLGFDKIGKANAFDEYVSDPAKPVPYTEDVHQRRTREYMTDDQRFASRRPDVLTYSTGTLAQDLTLGGPVVADLLVAITGTDADFVVKVIDEFPQDFVYDSSYKTNAGPYLMPGYQMLVRGEIMRGKYRNSFEKPAPFAPNKIERVKFELPDVAHTFKKGHKLVVQIQSTWFPLADRNPQQFMNIYQAKDADYKKANIRIYRGANAASHLVLPVLAN